MATPLRWGFVGAGRMAYAMARDTIRLRDHRIACVFSRSEESRQAFATDFRCEGFSSLEDLVASDKIDVVYINTPNQLHYPQVKLALKAGKPVMCEKPFTLNADQLAELIEIARAKKLFLMEAMWVRFLPAVVRLRELLAKGAIGEITWMQASFHSKPDFDPSNRFFDPGMGGGALLDLGIYPISFASMVLGKPQGIYGSAKLAPTGVDERFAATFEYESGTRANVSAGFGGYFEDEIVLQGTEGHIRIPRFGGWKIDRLVIEHGKKSRQERFRLNGRGYGYQAIEVARCLAADELESPIISLNESLSILETLDSLRALWGMRFPGE
jgi:dihydrodiol dehydrogenase / D-xylose 1-dehydrogenase (NADP)